MSNANFSLQRTSKVTVAPGSRIKHWVPSPSFALGDLNGIACLGKTLQA